MIKTIGIDEIVEMHCRSVFAVCCSQTTSTEAAWDAYQETFLVLTRKFDTLDCGEDLGPWLRETARRCGRAAARKKKADARVISLSEPEQVCQDTDEQAHSLEVTELIQLVAAEVKNLSSRDRKILTLAYQQNKPHREIAAEVGCPPGSVHSRLNTARERLRNRLSKRGIAMSVFAILFALQEKSIAFALSPNNPSPKKRLPPTPPAIFASVPKLAVVALVALISVFTVGAFMVAADTFASSQATTPEGWDEDILQAERALVDQPEDCDLDSGQDIEF